MALAEELGALEKIPRRDRVAYGAVALSLVLFAVAPFALTALERALLPPELEVTPRSPALERALGWIRTHEVAIERFAIGAFALSTGALVGYEVLKRLLHPTFAVSAPRWPRLRDEVAFALGLAILPSVVLDTLALIACGRLGLLEPGAWPVLLVSPWVAIAGTCYAVSFAFVLSFRLTRPERERS